MMRLMANHGMQIIDAIAALAHRLGMKVVAQGIETEAQYHCAKKLDCDFAQGYLFGKPQIVPNGQKIQVTWPKQVSATRLSVAPARATEPFSI